MYEMKMWMQTLAQRQKTYFVRRSIALENQTLCKITVIRVTIVLAQVMEPPFHSSNHFGSLE